PVIEGLPRPGTEDQLKALGAAAATTGSVGMFHAVGITPEAPTREAALGGRTPDATLEITRDDGARALRQLSAVPDGTPITAVCLGTPHFSRDEWSQLLALLAVAPRPRVPIYVNTGRATLEALETDGLLPGSDVPLIVVTDTCTYLTPILERLDGAVM